MKIVPASLTIAVVFLASAPGPAPAQPNQQALEQRIASLPPAERAYERFRFWVNQLPPGTPEVMQKYRAHLKELGYSSAQVDEQIGLVESQSQRSEAQRWNRILTSEKPMFNTRPNDFLVEMVQGRKPGAALDVGMGQGRNAIWLAQQGWSVTGFDPAAQAVALALKTAESLSVKLQTEIKTSEEFDFGERKWDLILVSYAGGRDLVQKVQRALRPGGLLVIEGFHRDATRGTSIGSGVVFDTGELPKLFAELRVVRYEEPVRKADFGQGVVRVVRYCAARPE